MYCRSAQGSILILITAVVMGILVIVGLFGLSFVRLVGTNSEQKTAIEAATLAAARDLSKIVIDTEEFGLIGISDSAPVGTHTTAGDNYFSRVTSINTLIGTARLDLLIAGQLGVAEWRTLALQDLENAKVAGSKLEEALQDSIFPTGFGLDKDGNKVFPYRSAEQAYNQNQIRLTGRSTYVADSLTLSLGAVPGAATNVPTATPSGVDSTVDAMNSINGCYKSYINVPLGGHDFVFAGIGKDIRLLDVKQWVERTPGLPFQIATVVKAEAVQEVHNARYGDSRIRAIACAQPASIYDPKPAPGALVISFPDGMPDGEERLDCPIDLFNAPFLSENDDDSDYYNSRLGDYPTDTSSAINFSLNWPLPSDPDKKASSCCKLAVYDWLRRGGAKLNVSSVVGMHATPFLPQQPAIMWPPLLVRATQSLIPTGVVHIYRIDRDGVISYESKKQDPTPYEVVADAQALMECHDAIKKGSPSFNVAPIELGPPLSVLNGATEFSSVYDLYVRLYTRTSGTLHGGKHGGEPLDADLTADARTEQDRNHTAAFNEAPPVIAFESHAHGKAAFPAREVSACGARAMGAMGTAQNVEKGALPVIGPREDFAFRYNLLRLSWDIDRSSFRYRKYATGSGIRQTYQVNGIASEIRFRRLVRAKSSLLSIIAEDGYIVLK